MKPNTLILYGCILDVFILVAAIIGTILKLPLNFIPAIMLITFLALAIKLESIYQQNFKHQPTDTLLRYEVKDFRPLIILLLAVGIVGNTANTFISNHILNQFTSIYNLLICLTLIAIYLALKFAGIIDKNQ